MSNMSDLSNSYRSGNVLINFFIQFIQIKFNVYSHAKTIGQTELKSNDFYSHDYFDGASLLHAYQPISFTNRLNFATNCRNRPVRFRSQATNFSSE